MICRQWGNLLTLAAVFRDPTLHGFVEESVLKELFFKTISFFRIIAHPTSALHVDLRILEGLERALWGKSNYTETMDHPTGSSFSSSTSGGPPPPPPLSVPPMSTMPPVSAPGGVHSPVNHVSNGMMSMSPPLASPLPATMSGASPIPSIPVSESPHQGLPNMGMLPPMQHQPPHH